ncbi:MAG: hypothetical protein HeimC3_38140 [Candidatus Heimdallarchaeota archaeon LC_3]|nr:MAG: hypothetical protein HeimC3_38140 [Candidatus Heimdallarchaeota archaeon LC_3]
MLDYLNLGSLKFKTVLDANGKKLGRIKNAVINKRTLTVRGFVIKGNIWEEVLEDIGLITDHDPLLPLDLIEKITEKNIVINKIKNELKNAMEPTALTDDEIFFSSFREMPVYDKNGDEFGFIIDIHFNKGTISYELGGKKFVEFLKSKYWTENLLYLTAKEDLLYSNEINGYELQSTIKEMESQTKLNMTNLVRDLMVEANKDGIITEEERKLIDTVSVDLETYFDALNHALEDGIITPDEEEKLEEIKENILKRTYIVARKDQKITDDERNLMKKLASYMVERRKELFWKVFGTSPTKRT